jgi:hypothetical protein
MRNHVYVRPAKLDDAKAFLDWSLETPNNEFDPEVVKLPSTFVMCAYNREGPLAYLPVQQPFMLESFASKPGATELQKSEALKALFRAAVTQAHIKGAGEIYFLSTDPGTEALAKNHAFEELPYKVFRAKLKDLGGR